MELQYNPIELVGPIGTLCDGYAHYNRALVRMLLKYQYPVKVTSAEHGNNTSVPVCNDKDILDAVKSTKDLVSPNVTISASIPPLYKRVEGNLNIGLTTWETSRTPTEWINIMNQMHAIIVPSKSVGQTFFKEGVKVPMFVLRLPINFDQLASLEPITIEPTVPRRVSLLYSGNWIPRKNIEDLVYAYCEAFHGVEDIVLTLKTWATNNDVGSRQHIDNAVRHLTGKMAGFKRPKILISTEPITDEAMIRVIKGADIVISTSHGEGLDSTLAYALALDKYVICDKFMGHEDFIDRKVNNYSYTMRPVIDSGSPFLASNMKWASPDYESLVHTMKETYSKVLKNDKSVNYEIRKDCSDAHVFSTFLNIITTLFNKYAKKVETPA